MVGWVGEPRSASRIYLSLCSNTGIKPIDIAAMMGHRNVETTLTAYALLADTNDRTGNMTALGAMASGLIGKTLSRFAAKATFNRVWSILRIYGSERHKFEMPKRIRKCVDDRERCVN